MERRYLDIRNQPIFSAGGHVVREHTYQRTGK